MNKRLIILYWLFLFIPTLVISGSVFHLLRHERDRMDQIAHSSAFDRARAIAESLQIAVAAVEDELLDSLYRIPDDLIKETLKKWEESNPLIRNIFIWHPKSGLQYPLPNMGSTHEEKRFVRRYNALFSGRMPWGVKSNEVATPPSMDMAFKDKEKPKQRKAPKSYSKTDSSELVQDIQRFRASQKKIIDMVKGESLREEYASGELKKESVKSGGWIPWFEENRLYIIGWARTNPEGLVYGVELELMNLLSRLIVNFPTSAPRGMAFALLDGSGRIFHQIGKQSVDPDALPDTAVYLAPYLPHWQVAGYILESHQSLFSGKRFFILSSLLLFIFIAAIVFGGSFLLWQAHRNMTDARQKTSFVSSVSHELKTPLTSIRMYAELLSEDRIKDPEKKHRYLNVIVEESRRLTRLVNNILDFGRLEQGRKKYHVEEMEMNEFLIRFLDIHQLRLKEVDMQIIRKISEKSAVVMADSDAIEQVLLNLLDNAIKYASEGREIIIELQVQEKECLVRVIDRGPGIPASHQKRIFEKFHRIDNSLTSQKPGSGLGLTISRRILRDMGGDLLFKPSPDKGSCFDVVLPLNRS